MQLQIFTGIPSLIFVRILPPERRRFADILRTIGENELTVPSNKGVVRFIRSSSDSVDARNLSDINIALTDDIIQYVIDSIEQHVREQEYHPFNCGLRELGTSVRPRSTNVVIQATSFFDVTTQEEMDEFMDSVCGFHDAIIREVAIASRTYIDTNGWIHNVDGTADARFVIQTQFSQIPCIEIVLEEIQALRLDSKKMPDVGLIGIVNKDGSVVSGNPSKRGNEMVLAKAMRYRILGPDRLGKELQALKTDVIGQSGTLEIDTGLYPQVSPPQSGEFKP